MVVVGFGRGMGVVQLDRAGLQMVGWGGRRQALVALEITGVVLSEEMVWKLP